VISPGGAVERHAALIKALRSDGFIKSFTLGMEPMIEVGSMSKQQADDLVSQSYLSLTDGLVLGDTVLVSSQAKKLVEFASKSLEPSSAFDLSVVPVRDAVVWFEDPLHFSYVINKDGKPMSTWCDGFIIHCTEHQMADRGDALVPLHCYFFLTRYEGDPAGSVRLVAPLFVSDGMVVGTDSSSDEGVRKAERDYGGLVGMGRTYVAFNPKPLLMALWSIVAQPIISESTVRPIEPEARKARKKLTSAGNVRVLSLRQRIAPSGEPTGSSPTYGGSRHYTHQWIVRGFWRNQRYGPKRSQVRRIWIDAYVKGPVDAPLSIVPRVYRVSGDS